MRLFARENLTRQVLRRRFAAAFLAVFFIISLPVSASAALSNHQSAYTKTTDTVLLICTDNSGMRMRSAYLIAMGDPIGILPLPANTRVQQTQILLNGSTVQRYAPLSQAYALGGQNRAESLANSVRYLLSGTSIDRTVVFTSHQIEVLTTALGGIEFAVDHMPAVSISAIGASKTYPLDTSNEPMALLLRRTLDKKGLTADYDMDLGRALRQCGGVQPVSVQLSGRSAANIFEFNSEDDPLNINLPLLHRQQQVILALIRAIEQSPESAETLNAHPGELSDFLRFFCDNPNHALPENSVLPTGYQVETGDLYHWIFDSSWLRSWIFDNIYAQ